LQQIREQRLMQLREDNGQYGNYSGQKSACTKFHQIRNDKRYDSIGSAPAAIVGVRLSSDPGALSIGAFERSRWCLRRTRAIYGF
jgi:hypothetical protein